MKLLVTNTPAGALEPLVRRVLNPFTAWMPTDPSRKPSLLLAERSHWLDQSGAGRGDQCRQRGDDQHDRDDD